MIEQDTIRLLRECDAGIKMGISSIDEVLDKVCAREMKNCLERSKREHQSLKTETQSLLARYRDEGKDPSPVLQGMSWVKTNVMLGMKPTDAAIADLMTEGSNMGVKSLSRYLNQYKAADEAAKNITKRLVSAEEKLAEELRPFL